MIDAQRFPYKIIDSSLGMVDRMPYLPLTLSLNGQSLNAEGLLDTRVNRNEDTPTIPLSRKRCLTLEMI
jgi:hypothetical protein